MTDEIDNDVHYETPDPDCEICEGGQPVVLEGIVQHCEGCCEGTLDIDLGEAHILASVGGPGKLLALARKFATRAHRAEARIEVLTAIVEARRQDPALRERCGCCRRCGPTVPCDSVMLGESCEGLCTCGVYHRRRGLEPRQTT